MSGISYLRYAQPFSLGGTNWLMRATLPVNTSPVPGGGNVTGLGHFNVFATYVIDTSNPALRRRPLVVAPTATEDPLGSGKWQLGVAIRKVGRPSSFEGAGALSRPSTSEDRGSYGIDPRCNSSHYGHMREIAARDAKNRFGQLLESAQSAPVRVTKRSRAVGVIMSIQQYERLRGAAWERLGATMDVLGAQATANGLTDTELAALLADES
jgi:prevent-host-death family protein